MKHSFKLAVPSPASVSATSGRRVRAKRWWPEIAAIGLALGGWQVGAMLIDFPLLPPFSAVLSAWWELATTGDLFSTLAGSLAWWMAGFALAASIGVTAGLMAGVYHRAAYLIDPIVDINLATPTLIYVPVLFALFGTGNETRVATVFLYAFPIITANVTSGVRYADAGRIEMARAFNATQSQVFRYIVLPDSLPMTMSGLRIGANRGLKGMVNGEMMIALVGLGAQLRTYGGAFRVDDLLAILLTIIVIAVFVSAILQRVDRRFTGWAEAIQ